jgi:predicted ATP-dependent serine protease
MADDNATKKEVLAKMFESGQMFRNIDSSSSAQDIEPLWGDWLIKKTLVVQVGQTGISKTTFNFDMILNIQEKGQYLGIEGKELRVLYFDMESGDSLIKSRLGLLNQQGKIHKDFYYYNSQGYDLKDLLPYINKIMEEKKINVVYFDPITLVDFSVDENSNSEATKQMSNYLRIRDNTGAAVILVCHPPKNDQIVDAINLVRGAGSRAALSDIVWVFSRTDNPDVFKFEIPKNRFVNSEFSQCIMKKEGEFIPVDDIDHAGFSEFKLQNQILCILPIGKEFHRADIATRLEIDKTNSPKQRALTRALTALTQKNLIYKPSYGYYQRVKRDS